MLNYKIIGLKLLLFFICFLIFFLIYSLLPYNSFNKEFNKTDIAFYSIMNQCGFYRRNLPEPTNYYVQTIVVFQLFTAFMLYII